MKDEGVRVEELLDYYQRVREDKLIREGKPWLDRKREDFRKFDEYFDKRKKK